MITYKLFKDPRNGEIVSVSRIHEDGTYWSIPLNEENTDYQKYLRWLAEGNEPLPPD